MTQIKITAAPHPLSVNPQPAPIRIRVVSGPQGAPGVPEIYIQQAQPTAKAANAIWYQTGLLGNIDSEWVWDGAAWLEVSSASSGVARVIGVAPVTVTGTSNAIVSVEDATQNTTGVLTLQMAADAAPVQSVIGGTNVDVVESGGNYTINAPANVSAFVNDAGYTNATQAAAAAPIQELVAGTDISIVENPGKSFTINALVAPQHQANWDETNTTVPSYIRNKPENVSDFNNDSGFINLAQAAAAAPVQSVNTKTGHVTLTAGDVGALPGNTYVPTKTSDLTNDGEATGGPFIDTADLATELAAYLPLAGGTVTGNLTVNQALLVPPSGSARGPTPPVNDASNRLATTEWVQDILAATGANRYTWFYNANYTGNDPGVGNLEIATDDSRIGISATDSGGNVRNLSTLMPGDTIVLTDDPDTGLTTEFARYDVTGNITDNGGWYQIPVELKGESNPPPAVGQDLRASFYFNSLASAIDGVSAGYGLTGGGMSGIVTLAIDTNVVAELSDIPTKVSELANDAGYVNTTQAAAAAPVQDIIAGTDISVTKNPDRSYTIAALHTPEHQSDWAETNNATPAYIKNKPTLVSTWVNDAGYITAAQVPPDAVTSVNGQTGVVVLNATDVGAATPGDIPTNVSAFTNDAGYITLAQVPPDAVSSVNAKTGVVVLNAADVGALPDNTAIPTQTSDLNNDGSTTSGPFVDATGAANAAPVQNIVAGQNITVSESSGVFTINAAGGGGGGAVDSVNGQTGVVVLTTSDLANDSGYITLADIPAAPVQSVNGQTGVVVLDAADVGALPDNTAIPTHTSDLTNDGNGTGGPYIDQADLSTGLADYLPLAGGTMSGTISWASGAAIGDASTANTFVVSTAGTERLRVANTMMTTTVPWTANVTTGSVVYATSTTSTCYLKLTNSGGTSWWTGAYNDGNDDSFRFVTGVGASQQIAALGSDGVFDVRFGVRKLRGLIVEAGTYTTASGATGDATIGLSGQVMTVSTAGTERLRVISTGEVGIGKSPSYNLDVNANASGLIFRAAAAGITNGMTVVSDGTKVRYTWNNIIPTDGTNAMVLDKDGNLGLSALSALGPQSRLDVRNGHITVDANTAAQPSLVFRGSSSTGIYSPAADTFAISTAGTERLRIDNNGKVGIGDAPTCIFDVASNSSLAARFRRTTPTGQCTVRIENGDANYFDLATVTDYLALLYKSGEVWRANGNRQFCSSLIGTAAVPNFSFTHDTDTGTFSPAGDTFAISTAGTERLRVDATGQITAAAGYTPTAGQDLATKAYVDAGGTDLTNVPDGTPAAPAIAFAADNATGIFRETATGCWCVSVGGSKRFEIDTTGDAYFAGWIGVAVPDDVTSPLDINGDSLRLRVSKTPATETEAAAEGTIAWDDDFLYLRTATVWKKTPWYSFGASSGGGVIVPPPGVGAGANWTRTEDARFAAGYPVLSADRIFFQYSQYSTDGITWTGVNGVSPMSSVLDRQLAVGNGIIMSSEAYSYDGIDWAAHPNTSIRAPVVYHAGNFYAASSGEGTIYYGSSPTSMISSATNYYPLSGWAASDGVNLVGIEINSAEVVSYQDPVLDAKNVTLTMSTSGKGLVFVPSLGISGTFAAIDEGNCYLSTDGGATWSTHALPTSADWAGLAWNGTRLCAVAAPQGASVAVYSDDGVNWTQSTAITNAYGITNIAGANGRFVAGGDISSPPIADKRGVYVSGN